MGGIISDGGIWKFANLKVAHHFGQTPLVLFDLSICLILGLAGLTVGQLTTNGAATQV